MNTLILCLEVFLARILDVSIGVVRTIQIVKEHTIKASILAFFEVLIWFIVARSALTTGDFNIFVAIFYSLGYACGTLLGSYLNKSFIKGSVSVEVISNKIRQKDINDIKKEGFGLSSITLDNKNKMLFIQVDNKRIKNLMSLLNKIDNKSFIRVSDTKLVTNGYVK